MNNRFIEIFEQIEQAKYHGVIKDICNKCRADVVKAADVYNPAVLAKYQREIVKNAVEEIQAIRNAYLSDVENALLNEQNKLGKVKEEKNSVEQLLEAVSLSNRIALLKSEYSVCTDEDLFNRAVANYDSIEINLIKAELMSRAGDADAKLKVRQIKARTEMDDIADSFRKLSIMKSDMNTLPGLKLAEQLIISEAGGIKQFLSMDIKDNKGEGVE